MAPTSATCRRCERSWGEAAHHAVADPGAQRTQSWSTLTLPTSPELSFTLTPCGWLSDFVKTRSTIPSVSSPLDW